MKTAKWLATVLTLVLTVGCSERMPAAPEEPPMTEARFDALRASAVRIANRVTAAGEITAADRIEIEALQRELAACVSATDASGALAESADDGFAAAAAPSAPNRGSPTGGCTPCPFIIVHDGCIGVLRSAGPCRPGAGLERCFYSWYCYRYAYAA